MTAVRIMVADNGPLRVEGEVDIVDQEGKAFGLGGRTVVSLCRCGHSERKPFCDGSHKKTRFQNVATAHDLPPVGSKP